MGKRLVILFGENGSGRTAMAQRLQSRGFGYHLTTGGLLREKATTDQTLAETMSRGLPVDNAFVMSIVEEKLASLNDTVFLDGIPKNADQLQTIHAFANNLGFSLTTVNLQIADYRRLLARCMTRVIGTDGRVYNELSDPPPAGLEWIRRSDDNEDAFQEMSMAYAKHTAPCLEPLSQMGAFFVVDAGEDIPVVFSSIKNAILGD